MTSFSARAPTCSSARPATRTRKIIQRVSAKIIYGEKSCQTVIIKQDRIGLRLLLTWGFVSNIFTKKMLNVCVLSCNYPFVKPGWCYKTRIINYLNVTTSEHWLSQSFKILHTRNMTKLLFWRIETEYCKVSWYFLILAVTDLASLKKTIDFGNIIRILSEIFLSSLKILNICVWSDTPGTLMVFVFWEGKRNRMFNVECRM